MIIDINHCNKQCWDCSKDCAIKKMFVVLPEAEFNRIILNSLKASMGMYLASGGNPKRAEEHLKKTSVALSIARKEYLKKHS